MTRSRSASAVSTSRGIAFIAWMIIIHAMNSTGPRCSHDKRMEILTTALQDRLLHHARVIAIEGESYRLENDPNQTATRSELDEPSFRIGRLFIPDWTSI